MMVSILMITYNHEKYIAQAIDSVLMQKTNFDFEIIIGEDCSTDRTREIALEYKVKYPDKIKLLLQEKNVGMMQNFIDIYSKCSGKYIAMLEGDDYWTDPYKLQKQVDFLEANPKYGLVHTDYLIKDEKGNINRVNNKNEIRDGDAFYWLFEPHYFIGTLTVMFRKDLLDAKMNLIEKKVFYDYYLWLILSSQTKIKYLNTVTAVYNSTLFGMNRNPYYLKRVTDDFIRINYFVTKYIILNKNLHPKTKYEIIVLSKHILNKFFNKKLNLYYKFELLFLILTHPRIFLILLLYFIIRWKRK